MNDTLCLLFDRSARPLPTYHAALSKRFSVVTLDWSDETRLHRLAALPWLIDLDPLDADRAGRLRRLLRNDVGAARLFVVAPHDRAAAVRAHALGATGVIARPVDAVAVAARLGRGVPFPPDPPSRRRTAPTGPVGPSGSRRSTTPTNGHAAAPRTSLSAPLATLAEAGHLLERIFAGCRAGLPIDGGALHKLASHAAPMLRAHGLEVWLEIVQTHHTGTYQHSLLVMGVAVAFGQRLCLDEETISRLAIAGLLHDVGKCWIPESILSKPGRLSDREFAVVREHCRLGHDALRTSGLSLPDDVLDAVLHHHEYLDGSGYPDGLRGEEIAPLARMLTVCDIFGALAENRSYRPAFPPSEIFQVLRTHARVGHVHEDHVEAIEACVARPAPDAATAASPRR